MSGRFVAVGALEVRIDDRRRRTDGAKEGPELRGVVDHEVVVQVGPAIAEARAADRISLRGHGVGRRVEIEPAVESFHD